MSIGIGRENGRYHSIFSESYEKEELKIGIKIRIKNNNGRKDEKTKKIDHIDQNNFVKFHLGHERSET